MAGDARLICRSEELEEGGRGVRFRVDALGGAERGFVVRYMGVARGYVNTCPHVGTELDWNPGEFFDEARLYLICSTHGAIFEPHTGRCVAGPCRGASLRKLEIVERDGQVYLLNDAPDKQHPAP